MQARVYNRNPFSSTSQSDIIMTSNVLSVEFYSAQNHSLIQVEDLVEPIEFTLPITQPDNHHGITFKHSCRYWDVQSKLWLADGCHVKNINQNQITCLCHHTTDYASFADYLSINFTTLSSEEWSSISTIDPSNCITLIFVLIFPIVYIVLAVVINLVECFILYDQDLYKKPLEKNKGKVSQLHHEFRKIHLYYSIFCPAKGDGNFTRVQRLTVGYVSLMGVFLGTAITFNNSNYDNELRLLECVLLGDLFQTPFVLFFSFLFRCTNPRKVSNRKILPKIDDELSKLQKIKNKCASCTGAMFKKLDEWCEKLLAKMAVIDKIAVLLWLIFTIVFIVAIVVVIVVLPYLASWVHDIHLWLVGTAAVLGYTIIVMFVYFSTRLYGYDKLIKKKWRPSKWAIVVACIMLLLFWSATLALAIAVPLAITEDVDPDWYRRCIILCCGFFVEGVLLVIYLIISLRRPKRIMINKKVVEQGSLSIELDNISTAPLDVDTLNGGEQIINVNDTPPTSDDKQVNSVAQSVDATDSPKKVLLSQKIVIMLKKDQWFQWWFCIPLYILSYCFIIVQSYIIICFGIKFDLWGENADPAGTSGILYILISFSAMAIEIFLRSPAEWLLRSIVFPCLLSLAKRMLYAPAKVKKLRSIPK
ncbi:latrophilin [Acrasis kona]|uniref:Latrophilin n=1 Tax=Acrasis kona TaxID=1008807 RepID=A0AAW2YNN2_9EUKA